MKSIMLSIQPKYCELIASGKKTIEVRKTRPKLETPFTCYMHETNAKRKRLISGVGFINERYGRGKVIGEFVCDKIDRLYIPISNSATPADKEAVEKSTCLSFAELKEYASGNMFLYGLHITDLKIYDEPKELGEFYRNARSYCGDYVNTEFCRICTDECKYLKGEFYRALTSPPQSWYYCEELN